MADDHYSLSAKVFHVIREDILSGRYQADEELKEKNIGEEHQPKNCIKCGKCEKACPQKLAIRQDLEKAQADLDKKEMVL